MMSGSKRIYTTPPPSVYVEIQSSKEIDGLFESENVKLISVALS